MKRSSPLSDPWNMSPEAKKKAAEIQKSWDTRWLPDSMNDKIQQANANRENFVLSKLDKAFSSADTGQIKSGIKMPEQKQRYIGDEVGKETSEVKQVVELAEYTSDLKEFKIIKDVYVLSDDREDDGTISVLIKLIPLMSIPAQAFEAENNRITSYLQSTSVYQAKEIHVSFQYTEVYK